jgi:hypothetical protein
MKKFALIALALAASVATMGSAQAQQQYRPPITVNRTTVINNQYGYNRGYYSGGYNNTAGTVTAIATSVTALATLGILANTSRPQTQYVPVFQEQRRTSWSPRSNDCIQSQYGYDMGGRPLYRTYCSAD